MSVMMVTARVKADNVDDRLGRRTATQPSINKVAPNDFLLN
jgi:hypothetical protein